MDIYIIVVKLYEN